MKTLVAIAFVALAAGCHHPRCEPGTKSKIEVRNGSGALTLAWKGDLLCDGNMTPVGTLDDKNHVVTLRDPAGKLRLELTHEGQGGGRGRDDDAPQLRLYRDDHELRVMRADGVPLASVVPQTKTGSVVYDKSSAPMAKVSLRDRDAVVTDMAGTAQTFVRPARDATTAGVFAVPSLDAAEQLALYIYWSH